MYKSVGLLFVVFGFVASIALASGSGSGAGSRAPVPAAAKRSPEQIAQRKYGNGLKHLEQAKMLTAKLEDASAAKDRAKLEGKVAKEYKKAIKDFRTATKKQPNHYAAFSSLGYALRKTGSYPESLTAYEQSLAIKPNYSPAIEYRAEAHLALDRLEEVKQAYLKLFTGDRERADELAVAMDSWLEKRRSDPGEVGAEAVEEFAEWVEKRRQIATQTSSLTQPSSEHDTW